jgi:hypothetical protein
MEIERLPLIEVIAPDGRKSLWVAAVPQQKALEAVGRVIPSHYVARFSGRRLTLNRKSDQLQPGEVRKVRL